MPVAALPGGADRAGEGFAGAEAVAQAGEGGGKAGGVEHLAVDAGGGGEERRRVGGGEGRPDVAVGRAGVDQRGGADGPGVGEAGAERVGPVEGAGVQDAVVRGEAVPAVPHHAAGPGGALGVDDALGPRAGAGGQDDVGGIVGGGGGEGDRRVVAEGGDLGGAEDRGGDRGQGEGRVVGDQRGGEVGDDRGELGRGELRRDRDGEGAEGVGGEEEEGEVGAVAEAEEQPVAGAEAALGEAAGGAADRVGEGGVGPALGDDARGGEDFERDLVGVRRGGGEGVRGHVERRGAGREGAIVVKRGLRHAEGIAGRGLRVEGRGAGRFLTRRVRRLVMLERPGRIFRMRSSLEIFRMATGRSEVLLTTDALIEAPNWDPGRRQPAGERRRSAASRAARTGRRRWRRSTPASPIAATTTMASRPTAA